MAQQMSASITYSDLLVHSEWLKRQTELCSDLYLCGSNPHQILQVGYETFCQVLEAGLICDYNESQ